MASAEVEWRLEGAPVPYPEAVRLMEERAAAIRAGAAGELAWLVEHPPLYTAGTSAVRADLLAPDRFPVYPTGRGGKHTYHGPGQRVAYLMLDLKGRGCDVRRYVRSLGHWVILSLARLGVEAVWRDGERLGVWVIGPDGAETKIAAIGVRLRQWVTLHGTAINVDPDLSHFAGIVPCGISGYGVTSLRALGVPAGLADLDAALRATFAEAFASPAPVVPSARAA